jgi:hypothetical protein
LARAKEVDGVEPFADVFDAGARRDAIEAEPQRDLPI